MLSQIRTVACNTVSILRTRLSRQSTSAGPKAPAKVMSDVFCVHFTSTLRTLFPRLAMKQYTWNRLKHGFSEDGYACKVA